MSKTQTFKQTITTEINNRINVLYTLLTILNNTTTKFNLTASNATFTTNDIGLLRLTIKSNNKKIPDYIEQLSRTSNIYYTFKTQYNCKSSKTTFIFRFQSYID